jgi:hypothetical protein
MTPDSPQSVAFDDRAGLDERTGALSELHQTYMPTASETGKFPLEAFGQVVEFIKAESFRQDLLKANAVKVPFPADNKGLRVKSVFLDDWQIGIQGEYYDRPSVMTFDMLRSMVASTPILNAVIITRINHVRRFARQNDSGEGPGFTIRHRDKDHKITSTEKQSIDLLSRFMTNCGWEFNPRARQRLKRTSLSDFMAMSVRDSLTMDASPIETEMKRDSRLGMDGFYAVDGSTIRLCTEDGYEGHDEVFAIQVIQSRIRAAYTLDDLIYQCRNPMANVASGGYGMSEVELLIRVVTGFLNAMTYNIKGFDDNSIPKGLLHLSGSYSKDDLLAFRTYWNAMVKGINNAWTLPVLISADQESKASFEKFGVEFSEMMFSKWMTFLTAIICALFGMSPDEINFESFSSRNGGIGNGNDTEEKLADSRDKGLVPLLRFYEDTFSDFIVAAFDEKYVFRWTGLDEEDRKAKEERQKLVLTVDEMRAMDGLDKHPDPMMGAAPVNPSLMGLYMQMQQAQQPQGEQDFGEGDDGENGQLEPGGEDLENQGKDDQKPPENGDKSPADNSGESQDFGKDDGQDFGETPNDFGVGRDEGKDFGKSFGMTVYKIEA